MTRSRIRNSNVGVFKKFAHYTHHGTFIRNLFKKTQNRHIQVRGGRLPVPCTMSRNNDIDMLKLS